MNYPTIHTAVGHSVRNTLFSPSMTQPTLDDLLVASDKLMAQGMEVIHRTMASEDTPVKEKIQAVAAAVAVSKYVYQRKRDNELAGEGQISIVINESNHGAD